VNIQELIQNGKAKLEAERAAREAAAAERERVYQEQVARERAEFQEGVLAALPEVMRPHVTIDDRSRESVFLHVPDCTRILIHVSRGKITDFKVWQPESIDYDYEGNYEVGYTYPTTAYLDIALALAAEAYPKEQELRAEVERRNAEHAKWNAEHASPTEPEEEEPTIDAAEQERERMVAFLENDPVAMDMVMLWMDIVAEREQWEARLESSEAWASRTEERLDQAHRATEDARRELNAANTRADEAEDRASDLERKARRCR
jgi:hypothetical protein